jgi:hypothetical protein
MMKEITIPLTYQIVKIVTENFKISDNIDIDPAAMTLYANISYQVNITNYSVRCTFDFGVMSHQKAFIEISTSMYFQLHEHTCKNLPLAGTNKEIPMSFAIYMAQATISTARGILHVETKNTAYNQYFIPDLNAEDLVKTRLIVKE